NCYKVKGVARHGLVPIRSAAAFVILILSGFSAFAAVYHSGGVAKEMWLSHRSPLSHFGDSLPMRLTLGSVRDTFRFLRARVHGKYTKHLVSIRISTHSDEMRMVASRFDQLFLA